MLMGYGDEAWNLLLDIPFGPCLLVVGSISVVKDRHFEHRHLLLLLGHIEFMSKGFCCGGVVCMNDNAEGA